MIETIGLTRTFGELRAVDEVSFTVPPGVLTGFVGGNGAGKTTSMRMIMGLLRPTAGGVFWQREPLTDARRRRFGYMPEERGLYPKQKVVDQLTYLAALSGMAPRRARVVIADHLERFGLADRGQERVEKLSLGNQQRVQIIAALMNEPTALILDEPFSGLDPCCFASMRRAAFPCSFPATNSTSSRDCATASSSLPGDAWSLRARLTSSAIGGPFAID